jgi:intracellular sulfur oxidation DsrE/DsrF family protein
MKRIILLVSVVAVLLAVGVLALWSVLARDPPAAPATETAALAPVSPKRYVFSIVLHKAEEIDQLLTRAEKLSGQTPATGEAGIALVLHGPEVEFFRRSNYTSYRNIVDRARRLDRAGVIEVKVCRTQMRDLNIRDAEMPDFVEIVPFGPAEVERLKNLGYVSL